MAETYEQSCARTHDRFEQLIKEYYRENMTREQLQAVIEAIQAIVREEIADPSLIGKPHTHYLDAGLSETQLIAAPRLGYRCLRPRNT